MPASGVRSSDTAIGKFERLAVEQPDHPANWTDEAGTGQAGPGHGLRPVKVVEDARENVRQNVFGGAAAFHVLCSQVFPLGRLQEINFMQRDALLFRKADSSACRRADHVVSHGLWRAGHFAYEIGLANRQALRAKRQAAWRAE